MSARARRHEWCYVILPNRAATPQGFWVWSCNRWRENEWIELGAPILRGPGHER
jgi:hypothetical protein